MSSYANHCWTAEREQTAKRLVEAAFNCDDDQFAEIMAQTGAADMAAVAALLAEQLSLQLLKEIEGAPRR